MSDFLCGEDRCSCGRVCAPGRDCCAECFRSTSNPVTNPSPKLAANWARDFEEMAARAKASGQSEQFIADCEKNAAHWRHFARLHERGVA